MRIRATTLAAAAVLCLAATPGHAALTAYTQNFEGLSKSNPSALSADGWVVYGNVFSPDHSVYLYGYGPFPAPNGSGAFCAIDTLQGGPLQGNLQLSVYSDYNNTGAHSTAQQVESNVYHEQTIDAADVGNQWTFQFDAKLGNLIPPSTALAFIKTINPAAGYATTNFLNVDMTSIPATWNTYTIAIVVDAGLVGQLMQFGYANTTTGFLPSGVFYDNVVWSKTGAVDVPGTGTRAALALGPAVPNPVRATTRIDFTLPRPGVADLGLYDVAGRRVATLFTGTATEGPHAITWSGRTDDGRLAASGVYWCVLQGQGDRLVRKLVVSR